MMGIYIPSRLRDCAHVESEVKVDFSTIGPRSRMYFMNVVTNLINPYSWSSVACQLTSLLQLEQKLPLLSVYSWHIPLDHMRRKLPNEAVDLIEANARMLGYRQESWCPGYLRHTGQSNNPVKADFNLLWPIIATQMQQHVVPRLTPTQAKFRQELLDTASAGGLFTTRVRTQ